MATPTELYINAELPKRPYTAQYPLTAGHVPVATGVGLEVAARQLDVTDVANAASETYVDDAINALVDGAPAALDTLNELAAAINDDANYASTVTTALGNRLRVDVNTQGLTATEQQNGMDNLGVSEVITSASIDANGLITFTKNGANPADTVQVSVDKMDVEHPISNGLVLQSNKRYFVPSTLTIHVPINVNLPSTPADNDRIIISDPYGRASLLISFSITGTGTGVNGDIYAASWPSTSAVNVYTNNTKVPYQEIELHFMSGTGWVVSHKYSGSWQASSGLDGFQLYNPASQGGAKFDLSAITAGADIKSITVPNTNVDLGQIPYVELINQSITYYFANVPSGARYTKYVISAYCNPTIDLTAFTSRLRQIEVFNASNDIVTLTLVDAGRTIKYSSGGDIVYGIKIQPGMSISIGIGKSGFNDILVSESTDAVALLTPAVGDTTGEARYAKLKFIEANGNFSIGSKTMGGIGYTIIAAKANSTITLNNELGSVSYYNLATNTSDSPLVLSKGEIAYIFPNNSYIKIAEKNQFYTSAFRLKESGSSLMDPPPYADNTVAFAFGYDWLFNAGVNRTITIPNKNIDLGLIGKVPAYANATTYVAGDVVSYDGQVFRCKTGHVAASSVPDYTKFSPANGILRITNTTGFLTPPINSDIKELVVISSSDILIETAYVSSYPIRIISNGSAGTTNYFITISSMASAPPIIRYPLAEDGITARDIYLGYGEEAIITGGNYWSKGKANVKDFIANYRYNVNDLVSYAGDLYKVTTAHTSGASFETNTRTNSTAYSLAGIRSAGSIPTSTNSLSYINGLGGVLVNAQHSVQFGPNTIGNATHTTAGTYDVQYNTILNGQASAIGVTGGAGAGTKYNSIINGYTNQIGNAAIYSTILGGYTNTQEALTNTGVSASYMLTLGGNTCVNTGGSYGIIGNGYNNTIDVVNQTVYSVTIPNECITILNGQYNTIKSAYNPTYSDMSAGFSTIVNGNSNGITGAYSVIGTGFQNNIGQVPTATNSYVAKAHNYAFIGTGYQNNIRPSSGTQNYGFIGTGNNCLVSGGYGFIGSGLVNTASAQYGTVLNGTQNIASNQHAYVWGGEYNTASHRSSKILSGMKVNSSLEGEVVYGYMGQSAYSTFYTTEKRENSFYAQSGIPVLTINGSAATATNTPVAATPGTVSTQNRVSLHKFTVFIKQLNPGDGSVLYNAVVDYKVFVKVESGTYTKIGESQSVLFSEAGMTVPTITSTITSGRLHVTAAATDYVAIAHLETISQGLYNS